MESLYIYYDHTPGGVVNGFHSSTHAFPVLDTLKFKLYLPTSTAESRIVAAVFWQDLLLFVRSHSYPALRTLGVQVFAPFYPNIMDIAIALSAADMPSITDLQLGICAPGRSAILSDSPEAEGVR